MNNFLEGLSPKKKLAFGIIATIVALSLYYVMYQYDTGFLVGLVCGVFSAMAFVFLVTYRSDVD